MSGIFLKISRRTKNDPANYDFAFTDILMRKIKECGAETIYRLGASIEHTEKKYFVFPPEDFEKYARICLNIIRHYNSGWANGFQYDLKYFEIWNEPDLYEKCGMAARRNNIINFTKSLQS